jgi:hypothetical protein
MSGGRPKKKKRHNLTLFNERRSRERRNVTANRVASVDEDQSHPASAEIPTAAALSPNSETAPTDDQSPESSSHNISRKVSASENARKGWASRRRNLQASSTRASQRTRFSRDMYVAGPAINERISESAKRGHESQHREETMREALVLSVRVFGVTAAQVHQAEQQCAGRAEVVAVLVEVLTEAQKQDARVRPALEVWRRKQEVSPREQRALHGSPHRRSPRRWRTRREATGATRALEVWQHEQRALRSPPHFQLSHRATNATGAPPSGRLGAKVRTTRQAVLLSLRALGANSNAVARADKRRSELDQLIAVLATMLTDSQKSHSLVLAAEDGKRMAVSWLLGVGVDPNSVGSEAPEGGWRLTPLVAAIKGGHEEIFHQLLATGVDHEKEAMGMRPLMWAAASGRVVCVEKLLLAGASVNAQNHYVNTALQHAAWGQHSSQNTQERDRRAALIVARLLEAGADKALVDHAGKTACRYAETRRHTRVMALLRDRPV